METPEKVFIIEYTNWYRELLFDLQYLKWEVKKQVEIIIDDEEFQFMLRTSAERIKKMVDDILNLQ